MTSYKYRNPNTGQFDKATDTQCVVDRSNVTLKEMRRLRARARRRQERKAKKIRQAIEGHRQRREEIRVLSSRNFNRAFEKLLKGKRAEDKSTRDNRLVDELLEAAYGQAV